MLSSKFRLPGYLLILLGIIAALVFFYLGHKPGFLQIKVFAIYSKYFSANYFKIIDNDIREELTFLLLLTGELFVALSRKKKEEKSFNLLRLKAAFTAFLLNSLLMIFCTLFIYGLAFLGVVFINCFSLLLFYIVTFEILLLKRSFADKKS